MAIIRFVLATFCDAGTTGSIESSLDVILGFAIVGQFDTEPRAAITASRLTAYPFLLIALTGHPQLRPPHHFAFREL